MELQIDGQSAMLGEVPTIISGGRYTYPEGGRFIREFGRSAPIPEAIRELERAGITVIIEPVVVPQSAAVPAYTAIGGKAYPYFEVPELVEEARAERGPSPLYEREYLAGLGKPAERYRVTALEEPSPPSPPSLVWEKYKKYIIAAGIVGVVGIVVVASR